MMTSRMLAVVAALGVSFLASTASGDPRPFVPGQVIWTMNHVTLLYDPVTGNLNVNSLNSGTEGVSEPLSTFQLESSHAIFIAENATFYPAQLSDVTAARKLLHSDEAGFAGPEGFNIGNVLPVGLTLEMLLQDLRVDGSYKTGGDLLKYGGTPLLLLDGVPEPSSVVLLFGFVGVLRQRRRATKGETAASRETAA